MFNKIKKLAKKAKEALKHVAEKVEEHIMAKEEIELKKMELVVDAVKDDKNRLILGLLFLGLGVGLGGSLIASVYIHSPIN